MIKQITMWKTRDGKAHDSLHSARLHDERLDQIDSGNEVLEAGGTVYDACLAAGYIIPSKALQHFTKDTKLIISHWQCCDEAVYSVVRFELAGIFVHGVGGWSGGYGDNISITDLGRYAEGTLEKLAKAEAVSPIIPSENVEPEEEGAGA